MIASGSWDNTLQAFSTIATDAFAVGDTVFSYSGHSAEVYAVAWSPDGGSIASASGDKTVQISNGIDGKRAAPIKVIRISSWHWHGRPMANASHRERGYNGSDMDPANGQKAFTYHGHSNSVFATAWSPDSKRIASASSDNTMQVWQPVIGLHLAWPVSHDTIAWIQRTR